MARVSKFTDEQELEIALELLSGKFSHAQISRKWNISSTYAYKLKDRALEILRKDIGRVVGAAIWHQYHLHQRSVAFAEPNYSKDSFSYNKCSAVH